MRNEESLVVEEGQALRSLEPRAGSRFRAETEHVDVLVIGGGQAGLSVGYHLARRGVKKFLILDANGRKFSKRDGAVSLQSLRDEGLTPADVRARIGL